MSLILERKIGESLRIGEDIIIILHRIEFPKAWLAIDAPRDVKVVRDDVKSDGPARRVLLSLNEQRCLEMARAMEPQGYKLPTSSSELFYNVMRRINS